MAIVDETGLRLVVKDEFSKALAEFESKTRTATVASSSFANELKGLAGPLAGLLTIGTITKLAIDSTKAFGEYAEAVHQVSNITGESAETSSQWVVQAQYVGIASKTVANGMAILEKNMVTNKKVFADFGVQVTDTRTGALLPITQVVDNLRAKEAQLGEGVNATAMEMKLLGRSGKELHEFFTLDATETAHLDKLMSDLGLTLDNQTNESLEKTRRSMAEFNIIQEAAGRKITENLIPILIKLEGILVKVSQGWNNIFDLPKITFGIHTLGLAEPELKKLIAKQEELTAAIKSGTLSEVEMGKKAKELAAVMDKLTGTSSKLMKDFELDKREEATKTVNHTKITTAQEAKQYEELAKKASEETMKSYETKYKLQTDDLRYLQMTNTERARSDKTYWDAVATDAKLKLKEKDDAIQKSAEAQKKINEELLKDTKKISGDMVDAFVAAASGSTDVWQNAAKQMASDTAKLALEPMASGLASMLSNFGAIGSIMTAGVGGVIGGILGGFLGLFGGQTKSVAEFQKDAMDKMVKDTNKALENIGKPLDAVKSAIADIQQYGLTAQTKQIAGIAGVKVGEGMSAADVIASLVTKLGQLPTTYQVKSAEVEKLKVDLPIMDRMAKDMLDKETLLWYHRADAAQEQAWMDAHWAQYGASNANDAAGKVAAAQQHLADLQSDLAGDQINSIEDQIAAQEALNKARTEASAGTSSVPTYASGGIVTKPTYALIGESGPEAVVPLGQGMGSSNYFTINVAKLDSKTDLERLVNDMAYLWERKRKTVPV